MGLCECNIRLCVIKHGWEIVENPGCHPTLSWLGMVEIPELGWCNGDGLGIRMWATNRRNGWRTILGMDTYKHIQYIYIHIHKHVRTVRPSKNWEMPGQIQYIQYTYIECWTKPVSAYESWDIANSAAEIKWCLLNPSGDAVGMIMVCWGSEK